MTSRAGLASGHTDVRRFLLWAAAGSAFLLLAACGPGRDADGADLQSNNEAYMASQVTDEDGASLGSVVFPVSCSEDASDHMRRGLALLHHMTYTQAEASFEQATKVDAGCSLGYWGMAMSYLHPLWPDVPPDDALDRGWELLEKARETGLDTDRERGYVTALEAYYRDATERSESQRLASYAEAWERVAEEHPEDVEASLFRALSLIAIAGSDPTGSLRTQAGELAEVVMDRIEDHPGAHHYVIHAYDVPALAERAVPAAERYGDVAPDNAHALHMTSHIFTRVGAWEQSIDFNARSAEAALRAPIAGKTSHHHLHAVDYLAYAHLQRAEDSEAEEVLAHLGGLEGPVVDNAASAYAFAAVPARIALEVQDWGRAADVVSRQPTTISWDQFPHLEAISHFTRALGAAHTDDLETAQAAVARLAELRQAAADMPSAYDWGTQVEIQRMAATSWIAFAQGRTDEAVGLAREAADLESTTVKNPVTPSEVLPARELLGDMLLELGRYADAQEAYELALERSPNRFNSLFGAGRAAELAGEGDVATAYYRRLVDVVGSSPDARMRLEHARRFIA